MRILIKYPIVTLMVDVDAKKTIQEFVNELKVPRNIINKKCKVIGFTLNGKQLNLESILESKITEWTEIVPIIISKRKKGGQSYVNKKRKSEANEEHKIQINFLGQDPLFIDKSEVTTIASLCKKIAILQNIPIPTEDPLFDIPSDFCSCAKVVNETTFQNFIPKDDTFICAICHNNYQNGCISCEITELKNCELTQLPCLDIFHLHCVKRWLNQANNCPLCSKDIIQEEKITVFHGEQKYNVLNIQSIKINNLQTLMIHHKGNITNLRQQVLPDYLMLSICGMLAHPESIEINVQYDKENYKISTLFTTSTMANIKKEMQRLTNVKKIDLFLDGEFQYDNRYLGELNTLQILLIAKIGKPKMTLDLFSNYSKISLPCAFYDETLIEDLEQFPIFGIWRPLSSTTLKQDSGWLNHFGLQNSWQTDNIPNQTIKGWNILLSSLIVISNILNKCNFVSSFLQYFDSFPPLKITFYIFIEKMETMIGTAEKAIFIQGIYYFLRKWIPSNISLNETFESSRIVFAYLLQQASLNIAINNKTQFHLLESNLNESNIYQIANSDLLALHVYKQSCLVLDRTNDNEMKDDQNDIPLWSFILKQIRQCRLLSIYSSNQFRFAPNPCLTLNQNNELCVFSGWEPCSADIVLFSPSLGREEILNPNKLSQSLNLDFDLQDDRIPIEGLMICLDVSQSMDSTSGFEIKEQEIEKDDIWKCPIVYGPLTQTHNQLLENGVKIAHIFQQLKRNFLPTKILKQWCHLQSRNYQCVIASYRNFFIDVIFNAKTKIDSKSKEPPAIFICPISLNIMENPVIAFDGFTYEKSQIEAWLKIKNFSPMTRDENINNEPCRQNLSLRSEIRNWKQKDEMIIIEIQQNNHTLAKLQESKYITLEELEMKIWLKFEKKPSSFSLWANLKNVGDGIHQGSLLDEPNMRIQQFLENDKVILAIYKFQTPKPTSLSRLEIVKQLFHAFINRSQAYDYPIHIGLQTFATDIELRCPMTPFYENFRDTIDEVEAKGDTALFQCIHEAAERLMEWKETKGQQANLRILVLSDGTDSKLDLKLEKNRSHLLTICRNLEKNKIRLDVVQIGSDIDKYLRGISYITNGLFFQPKTLSNAMRLNELETFLCVQDRVDNYSSFYSFSSTLELQFKYGCIELDRCDEEKVPKRKNPRALLQKSVKIENIKTNPSKSIMKALICVQKNPHPAWDIFPVIENIYFWKLILQGPKDSPYELGCWLLYAQFPLDYPQSPPEIRFVTPIKHANVNDYGKICHSIFTRNYTPHITISKILSVIYGLLLSPDIEDPVDSSLVLEYYAANGIYEMNVMNHVKKHASLKTRKTWNNELE